MRHPPTPMRIGHIAKSQSYRCWRRCGEKGTLLHCWWDCKLIQPLWKEVWRIFKELKIDFLFDPAILLLGLPKINMNLDSIHRLIEESQIFQPQQSAVKRHGEKVATASSPRDTCHRRGPLPGLQSQAAPHVCTCSCSSEWHIREELRLRELEEAKARAAQMEKTMRWWSDCTADWREKWSKVRAERNSAREEGRQLRLKLEMRMKELSELKKQQCSPPQQQAVEAKVTQGPGWPGFVEESFEHRDQCLIGSQMSESIRQCLVKRQCPTKENTSSEEEGVVIDSLKLSEEMKPSVDCVDLFKNDSSGNDAMKPELRLQAINLPLENERTEISALQVHLDEFQKVLWKEREMRTVLEKEIERLESALSLWKWKYEELKEWKPKTVKEADILHSQQENEMEDISGDIKEESKSQNSKDRVIYELRTELERLQAENALEWDKREILETEKQGLERENRRLKIQVKEMEELLGSKNRISANSQDCDFKRSQIDLQEQSKEPSNLQHAHSKLSRQHQATITELTHANDQAAQDEAELKKLRAHVEKLKQRLHQKEDEIDDSLNQIRKLQRSLDEQKETNENLELQLRHLQSW
ncbi:coiled-coil domain-containing protein 102B isoform X2 [Nycticebus coucang]|nr:coiled-coil domain-containing protein 102B isoform X2 [Nycticebus coucang]